MEGKAGPFGGGDTVKTSQMQAIKKRYGFSDMTPLRDCQLERREASFAFKSIKTPDLWHSSANDLSEKQKILSSRRWRGPP
jgi:hypothetical protein